MSNANAAGHHASKWFLLPGTGEHMGCAPTQPQRNRLLAPFVCNIMTFVQAGAIRHKGALG